MKTLVLLRHAKAENTALGAVDLSRSLTESGTNGARSLGRYVKAQNLKFDLVLCSTATRARETAELVLATAELPVKVRYDHRIYDAGTSQLLELVSNLEKDAAVVLLVGHNPGMAELLRLLTGRSEQMATGTLAQINFDFDNWSQILKEKRNPGSLVQIVRPG